MHNTAAVLENDTDKLLWDFNIQTDHIISARRPDLIVINKKKRTCKVVDFDVPADHRIKLKESEKKDKYLDLARELKKLSNMKCTNHICDWCTRYSNERTIKRSGGLGKKRASGNYPNYCIIEIGQNTEKSPRDLSRLAVSQIPVKDHQLTLM